ncbi:hypothetical protein BGZ54_002953 [Gamsiella multidivaricata]|nr:hypothetical protein BGZ54_002953 [Gamsiella multidivaricata]
MNSASACLTNNGDKYFVPFKPEGSRSTHFRLAYAPGDFDTAVREYDGWMEKLIKHDWPLCFGVPKEGAVPIHILEQQSRTALEQESSNVPGDQSTTAETTALNDISSALATTIALNGVSSSTDTDSISTLSGATPLEADSVKANGEYPTESKKRSPEPVDTELDKVERSTKKAKAELDSEAVSGADRDLDQDQVGASEQDSKVAERFEQLELKSTSSAASSLPSTPATMTPQEPESASVLESVSASAALVTALAPAPAPLFSAAMVATAKTTKAATPQPDVHRVDEYRLEDLDLTNVPTSLSHVVRVDESTIPNSGNGLFAKIDIPASTPLGFYFGVPMTENEFDSLKDGVGVASHYSIMYRRTVLDATDENGTPYSDPNGRLYCPFHFMNEDPSGNITFITGSVVNQVICQTNRDVKAGEELFVFYGKEVDRFWEKEKEAFRSDTNSDHKKGKTGSRAASPVRREESTTDRPRRNNIYKPARYTR